jgi:hypothetical protein
LSKTRGARQVKIGTIASIILTAVLLNISTRTLAQDDDTFVIDDNTFAFHADQIKIKTLKYEKPVVEDVEIFVEMIGIPNIPKINDLRIGIVRSRGMNNAKALIKDNIRYIVYDPVWANTNTAEFYLTLGHEAGHHFCNHRAGTFQSDPIDEELEADRFSGQSIRSFEAYHGKRFIDDALEAAKKLYDETGARTHPPRAQRLEAIMLGYNEGSPCADLAPGIRGFSATPR